MSPQRRLLLLTPNLGNNSLGRTYCLWLLARHLGHDVIVASVKGTEIWQPLAGSDFARACRPVPPAGRRGVPDAALLDLARWSDVVVAVKPVPNSFGVGQMLTAMTGRPLLLDIDDPDIEVRTTWRPVHQRLPRRLLSPSYRHLVRLKEAAQRTRVLVSNPELQRLYGGRLVPHVRAAAAPMPRGDTHAPVVRFVGSPRGHKGVDVLRRAVERLAGRGFRLEVTADPPDDAHPWERWLGTTSFEEGQRLVATADVVAIPSLAGGWSPAQLPVKLVDAMMAGAAVVASDIGPIAWALGDAGVLVPAGDLEALTDALADLWDPQRRKHLGGRAHARALAKFSVESVAPTFAEELQAVLATHPPASSKSAAGAPS